MQPTRTHQHEEKVLLILTLIIGAVVGLVVVAFILLTENLGSRLYPPGGAGWRRLLVPVAGALFSGFLLSRYFPNARGSGIPQTKAALFLKDGFISFRTVIGKFSLCSLSLATGIALGREGPSVHIGSGIASSLGRKLGLSTASIKALVPTGASAALAAAFNTPISAVLFSLEEVMGDMHAPVLGSIVLGSATSWIVLHLILGDEPLFHVPAYQLVHPIEFVFYAVLGVVGGIVSTCFVKLLLWQRMHFLRAPKSASWFMPVIGGLTVGVLGWYYPEVLGVGYGVVSKALNGQIVISAMALLVVLKIIATATCYSSGNAGGIFGPSLFIGAMMGGAVGGVAHQLMPDYTGSVGAYALVGMGAAFAGIVRTPLTSVIMVFEITRDYSIVVPLMIANLMSYFISTQLQEEPIYDALQHQDGIRLPSGARARDAFLVAKHAYRPESQILAASEKISDAVASIDRERGAWPVVDESGLRGMVTLEQFDGALQQGAGNAPVATLLSPEPYPYVFPDDPLENAMQMIAAGPLKVLPVVSRTNLHELKGTISLQDILSAYALGSGATAGEDAEPIKLPMKLLAGILTALVVLAIVAGVMSHVYRTERQKRGDQYFVSGNELMQQDRVPEAIEQYRNALSISHKPEQRLALGLGLVKAGRMNEAAVYLNEVLRHQPGSGPANLGLAAIEMAAGHTDGAILHFQRAIVGSWPDHAEENRRQARMQMIEYLSKSGRKTRARSELLALAGDLPQDPAFHKQVGRMLLDMHLPREAADLYRESLKSGPPDAAEYDGLGEAEFQLAEFSGAADAFHNALKIDPADQTAAHRAELCDKVLALDPTRRGVAARERFQRSEELMSRVDTCTGTPAAAPPARKKKPSSYSDAADANVARVEQIWSDAGKSCRADARDPVVETLMGALLSQRGR